MNGMKKRILFLCRTSLIAALYVVLTYVSSLVGLSSGVIQCRLSEAICVLPYFTFSGVPGLTAGCLISNLIFASNPFDIVFGTVATLLGALGAYLLRRTKLKWAVALPTVLSNTLIVPFVLKYAYGVGDAVWFLMLTVGTGELISAWILGTILLTALDKRGAKWLSD